MKKVSQSSLILLALMFLPISAFCQANGMVLYKVVLESEGFKEKEGILYFQGPESFFYVDTENNNTDVNKEKLVISDNEDFTMALGFQFKENEKYEVYINRKNDKILNQRSILKNWESKPCVLVEKTGIIIWEIMNETKTIGKFEVTKAKTSFRGREYIAWFAPEIAVPIGPWKFHGLPGLILEVQDKELGVQFLFKSILSPYNVEGQIKKPDDGPSIDLEEFIEYQNNLTKELTQSIRARLRREATVSDISVQHAIKSIEREY